MAAKKAARAIGTLRNIEYEEGQVVGLDIAVDRGDLEALVDTPIVRDASIRETDS